MAAPNVFSALKFDSAGNPHPQKSCDVWLRWWRKLKVHLLLVCLNIFSLKVTSYKEFCIQWPNQLTYDQAFPPLSFMVLFYFQAVREWAGLFSTWASISCSRLASGLLLCFVLRKFLPWSLDMMSFVGNGKELRQNKHSEWIEVKQSVKTLLPGLGSKF